MTTVSRPTTPTDDATHLDRVAEALDARRMGPRLRVALGVGGPCHVVDAKYEPGVRGLVLYRIGDRLVRGDLLDPPTDGGSRPVVPPGVRLACFPDDPDLPRLADTVDPDRLRDALRDALPGRILRCRIELLRYRPGKRATLAVEVRAASGPPVRRLVVKSYHDGRKAAAVAAEAVLLDATTEPSAALRFAPVRGHLPDLSLVLQQHVTGIGLDQVLRGPYPAAEQAARRAATALAQLHRRPLVSGRLRDVDAEVARFALRSSRVARVAPATGAALGELAARLAATARTVPTGVVGLVHGDCKPSQFLLRGDRDVVLLDLDSCGRADPAADVATFLATLRQHALRGGMGARSPAGLAATFLDAYVREAVGTADAELRRRIWWYEAVALERKALRCFARAPRSPLTAVLVAHGHACLDRLGGTR
jgi:aminoglycoside phosphotransferase (APT) family kinase protein